MGQFKPMVKMETTEPSVILKLAKGGFVAMKKGGKVHSGHKKMAGGGALEALAGTPALIGRPAVNAPVRAPGKPSMAMRRKAMMAKRPAMAPEAPMMPPGNPGMPGMKKGGMAEGGKMDDAQDKAMIKKAFKQHDTQEHKGGKGTSLKLKDGGMNCATGGVAKGQGGYATGGVAKSNGGGYKMGGKAKKMAEGGGLLGQLGVDESISGGGIGGKLPSPSGSGGDASAGLSTVNQGASTIGSALKNIAGSVGSGEQGMNFQKRGGKVSKKAFATGGAVDSGRSVAMPQGRKKPSQPISTNRLTGTFKDGGGVEELVDSSKGAYDRTLNEPPMGMGFAKKVHGVIDSLFAPKKEAGAGRGFINPPSVTKSKESVTVTKKHGGLSK